MNCVKLLGQWMMSRDFGRHVAEAQICAAVFYGFTAFGIFVAEPLG